MLLTVVFAYAHLVSVNKLEHHRHNGQTTYTFKLKKTSRERFNLTLFVLLTSANIAFSLYSMYFVISYIIEFHKLRDLILAGIGCFIVIALNITLIFL